MDIFRFIAKPPFSFLPQDGRLFLNKFIKNMFYFAFVNFNILLFCFIIWQWFSKQLDPIQIILRELRNNLLKISSKTFWKSTKFIAYILKERYNKSILVKRCSEKCNRFTPMLKYNFKLHNKFIESTLQHGFSPSNLLQLFRTTLHKNCSPLYCCFIF